MSAHQQSWWFTEIELDQVFKDIGCHVKQTALQAPNQNAFIER